MKYFILALISLAVVLADNDCLARCKTEMMERMQNDECLAKLLPSHMITKESRTKYRTLLKNLVNGEGTYPDEITDMTKWTKFCTEFDAATLCLNTCPEGDERTKFESNLLLLKLGCDENFKSSIECVHNFFKTPSPVCTETCRPQAVKLMAYIAERDADPDNMVLPSTEVMDSKCKFFNCRLNCRKTDLVTACQQKGLDSTKKFMQAMTTLSKVIFKKGGGADSSIPESCSVDGIVAEHEYHN